MAIIASVVERRCRLVGLNDYIEAQKGDIISIVGAGGKTTLMFNLARELALEGSVLVTTTTKIYLPDTSQYTAMCLDPAAFESFTAHLEKGIYVMGLGVGTDHKVLSLEEVQLNQLAQCFDYILIEADGSKRKPLKGWRDLEPVIYSKTTKTIGLLNIQALGLEIGEEQVHRSELFCQIAGAQMGDRVKEKHLVQMIQHPEGLFKESRGERILMINKVESHQERDQALALSQALYQQALPLKIVMGSLHQQHYEMPPLGLSAIVMASGFSKRMGQDKLLLKYQGQSLIERTLETIIACGFKEVILVGRSPEILAIGQAMGVKVIQNDYAYEGISASIKLGLAATGKSAGYAFIAADQPFMEVEWVKVLMAVFQQNPQKIVMPVYKERRGNPVIFPSCLKDEFMALTGDIGGKQIIKAHEDWIHCVPVEDDTKLYDVDTMEEYEYILNLKEVKKNE